MQKRASGGILEVSSKGSLVYESVMHLPADITKKEMIQILQELWAEYLPREDLSFVEWLDEWGLRLLFDFIGEKDEEKRAVMWDTLEQSIANNEKQKLLLSQAFIQKANKLILQHRETLKQQEDNVDLEQLEENF